MSLANLSRVQSYEKHRSRETYDQVIEVFGQATWDKYIQLWHLDYSGGQWLVNIGRKVQHLLTTRTSRALFEQVTTPTQEQVFLGATRLLGYAVMQRIGLRGGRESVCISNEDLHKVSEELRRQQITSTEFRGDEIISRLNQNLKPVQREIHIDSQTRLPYESVRPDSTLADGCFYRVNLDVVQDPRVNQMTCAANETIAGVLQLAKPVEPKPDTAIPTIKEGTVPSGVGSPIQPPRPTRKRTHSDTETPIDKLLEQLIEYFPDETGKRQGLTSLQYVSHPLPKGVVVSRNAVRSLGSGQWLNDEAVNYGAVVMVEESKQPWVVLPPWTLQNFIRRPKLDSLPRRLRTTRQPFMMLYGMKEHWILVVVQIDGRYYLVDSLKDANRQEEVQNHTLMFLNTLKYSQEWRNVEWTIDKTHTGEQQRNGHDCGIFLIANARAIAAGRSRGSNIAKDVEIIRETLLQRLLTQFAQEGTDTTTKEDPPKEPTTVDPSVMDISDEESIHPPKDEDTEKTTNVNPGPAPYPTTPTINPGPAPYPTASTSKTTTRPPPQNPTADKRPFLHVGYLKKDPNVDILVYNRGPLRDINNRLIPNIQAIDKAYCKLVQVAKSPYNRPIKLPRGATSTRAVFWSDVIFIKSSYRDANAHDELMSRHDEDSHTLEWKIREDLKELYRQRGKL